MSLRLNSSGGGSITLQEPSTASNRTLTLPDNTGNLISSADSGTVSQTMLASGVAGTGPAFNAYRSANVSYSLNTSTKLIFDVERFDYGSCYDASTGRFTPNVAGVYMITTHADNVASSGSYMTIAIWKNGTGYANGTQTSNASGQVTSVASTLVYLNGTTDYVEAYVSTFSASSTPYVNAGASNTTGFSGFLARAA